jgi:hypothetical protein
VAFVLERHHRSSMILRLFIAVALPATAVGCAIARSDKPRSDSAAPNLRTAAILDTPRLIAARSASLPPLPWVRNNVCPRECCQLGEWTTTDSIVVYAREGDSASRSFTLPPHARVVAESGDLHTVALGVVTFKESTDVGPYLRSALDSLPFTEGASLILTPADTVLVTGEISEEGPTFWIRGRAYAGDELWQEPDEPEAVSGSRHRPGRLVTPLREEWWVHFHAGERSGWFDAFRNQVEGSDACG